MAGACGPECSSCDSSVSRFKPSSNGSVTAASTHLMIFSGAFMLRRRRALALRKLAMVSGFLRAASILSVRSRTRLIGFFSATMRFA
jgi:hypothetical protein